MKVKCLVCNKEFETKESCIANGRGKHCSRSCANISKKTYSSWNKGLKGILKPNSGSFKKGNSTGEKNNEWKGDDVGYQALHDWVYRWKGKPSKCDHCGYKENLSWANKSQEYKRELEDWISLCYWCHRKYDGISKLSRNDVISIRNRVFFGEKLVHLSIEYKVNAGTIWNIVHRRTWKNV